MKFGREVEGRFKGLLSLFMSAEEFLSYSRMGLMSWAFDSAKPLYDSMSGVCHVYVSDHTGLVRPGCPNFAHWEDLLITLEVRHVPINRADYPPSVHLMLAIVDEDESCHLRCTPNTSFWRLRDTDQIKITKRVGPSGGMVAVFPKEVAMMTHPSAFRHDLEIHPGQEALLQRR